MTTPALQRLREALPDAHLTLLTHEKLASLWQHHPSLDAIITFSPGESPWSVARRLRAESFQTAVVLPNSPRSALEVWLARIPQRIGYARPWWSWLLTRALAPRPGKVRMSRRSVSEVRRLIRLPADAAVIRLPPPARAHRPSNPRLPAPGRRFGRESRTAPAEAGSHRRGNATGGARLLSDLRNEVAERRPGQAPDSARPESRRGIRPRQTLARGELRRRRAGSLPQASGIASGWPLGAPGDWQLCSDIARLAGGGVLNLAGKTSLRQLMALLKLCRVVLTNDTGPMHVAAALGTPVVVPFGSTVARVDRSRFAGRPPPSVAPVRRALLALLPPRLPH